MGFEIKKRMIIDPTDFAYMVEQTMEPYLKKVQYMAGAYIEGCSTPLVLFDNKHYRREKGVDGKDVKVPVLTLEDIRGVIYNGNDDIVIVPRHATEFLPEPTIPIRGIRIIQAYIDKVILDNCAWATGSPTLQGIWGDFITPEYYHTLEVYERMENVIYEIRNMVKEFIGPNKWLMNFRNSAGRDIVIEQSIDYRIHQWCLEHNQPL